MSLREYLLAAAPAAAPGWYAALRARLYGELHREWTAELRREPPDRILDWGTGCGELALALAAEGCRSVDAVDESDHLLLYAEEQARRGDPRRAPRFHLLGEAGPSPCPGPYPRILCAGLRHGTESLLQTFARIHRRLGPGGELWWADLRADAPELPELERRLREEHRPGPLSRLAFPPLWRGALGRLPTDDAVEDAVRESAFGTAQQEHTRDVVLGERRFRDVLRCLRLRREELVAGPASPPPSRDVS